MDGRGYCALLLFTSFFAMWSAGTVCTNMTPDGDDTNDYCKDEIGWALVCSLISLIVSIVMLILYVFLESVAAKIECGTAIFFTILWLTGVAVCTFKKPFTDACGSDQLLSGGYSGPNGVWQRESRTYNSGTYQATWGSAAYVQTNQQYTYSTTGNGYITFWVCMFASAAYMMDTVPFLKGMSEKTNEGGAEATLLGAVVGGCIMVMVQGAYDCGSPDAKYLGDGGFQADNSEECKSGQAWAVIVGTIGAVIGLLLGLVPPIQPFRKYIMPVVSIFLFIGIATLTFVYRDTDADSCKDGAPTPRACPATTDTGTFGLPGNGFFGIWVATFASFALTYALWTPEEESMTELMQDPRVHVGIMAVASFFEMWAAGIVCDWKSAVYNDNQCTEEFAFAVGAGALSLIVCIVMVVLYLVADGPARQIQPVVAAILFLWWCAAFIVITFQKPFTNACGTHSNVDVGIQNQADTYGYDSVNASATPSPTVAATVYSNVSVSGAGTENYGSTANGYIATWIAFIAAVNYLMSDSRVQGACAKMQEKSGEDGFLLMPLALASLIVMAQGAFDCDDDSQNDGCAANTAWAVTAGIISLVLVLVMMLVGALASFKKYLFIVLVVWWFMVIAVLTFSYKENDTLKDGIFANAGNGFFATWLAFLTSITGMYSYWVAPIGGGDDEAGAAEGGAAHEAGPPKMGLDDDCCDDETEKPADDGEAPGEPPPQPSDGDTPGVQPDETSA